MKKILCLALVAILMLSMTACGEALFVKSVAGTWSCRMEESAEYTQKLLESFELYEEEIALIDTPLYTVKHVQFNEDMTYRYYYDVDLEKECVREFFVAMFDSLYEGKSTLTDCYEIDLSTLSKDEFFQFYADLYMAQDYDALIDTFVDNAYDYDTFANAESGTYTINLNQITKETDNPDAAGTIQYKVKDNTLTLTYSDGTEVYTKVN